MAITLDGINDYILIADSPDWDFGTGDWAVTARILFNGLQTGDMVARDDADFRITYNNPATTFQIAFGGSIVKNPTWAPVTKRWYHWVVSRTGTDLQIFVDNVELGTPTTNSTNLTYASAMNIGRNSTNSLFVDGVMTEVAIWKGIALTAGERRFLYSGNLKYAPLQIRPASLVLYMPLDEFANGTTESGTGANRDRSPAQANNGDPTNSPVGKAEEVLTYS